MAKSTLYPINLDSPVQITREEYTNVGAGDNILGDYDRGFYGTTGTVEDFEIWDSAVGGNQLVEGTDYVLENLDINYSTRAQKNVYKTYRIITPAYQVGSIFITYKTIGTYITTGIINAIGITSIVYIDNTDSPYTITDSGGGLVLFVNTSGGNVNVTMPILADNQGRNITIIHQTGGNNLNVDGEGAETIEGLTDIDLPKQGDRLKIIGTSALWTIIDERISCQLRLDTYAGYGSTDNKIMRLTNSRENYGNMFSENHSTGYNGNTEGLEITIIKPGKYQFTSSQDSGAASGNTYGLSLNSSQLTTGFISINAQDKLITCTNIAGYNASVSWGGRLAAGDVVRYHGDGIVPQYNYKCMFTASYMGN